MSRSIAKKVCAYGAGLLVYSSVTVSNSIAKFNIQSIDRGDVIGISELITSVNQTHDRVVSKYNARSWKKSTRSATFFS